MVMFDFFELRQLKMACLPQIEYWSQSRQRVLYDVSSLVVHEMVQHCFAIDYSYPQIVLLVKIGGRDVKDCTNKILDR